MPTAKHPGTASTVKYMTEDKLGMISKSQDNIACHMERRDFSKGNHNSEHLMIF